MSKQRLEAFSDGVIAILITIMVLELKVPHGADWASLHESWPKFFTYVLSFVFLGIYWNNHHHMLHLVTGVSGGILWANLHLLFWLSLVPVATGWMGESHLEALPTAVYGGVMVMCTISWLILQTTIVARQGRDSALAAALGGDVKGKLSFASYVAAIPIAFVKPYLAVAIYVIVALVWFIPDRRMESHITRAAD
jgi:uncharacterized membrane protein